MDALVERITWDGQLLACVVRARWRPEATTFVTEPELFLQVGLVIYPKGGAVPPHTHRPVERRINGTHEVLVVQCGRCVVDIFNDDRALVASPELGPGDLIIVTGGGQAYRMLEDTVLLEVKQGPYVVPGEKVMLEIPERADPRKDT